MEGNNVHYFWFNVYYLWCKLTNSSVSSSMPGFYSLVYWLASDTLVVNSKVLASESLFACLCVCLSTCVCTYVFVCVNLIPERFWVPESVNGKETSCCPSLNYDISERKKKKELKKQIKQNKTLVLLFGIC